MRRLEASLLVAVLSFCYAGYAEQHACTSVQAERAEREAGMVRTWEALYKWYRTYRGCDDGVIAETSSAAVGGILLNHWNTLPRLAYLARRDVAFRQFVLRHFAATIEMKDIEIRDVEKIKKKARTQCPKTLQTLCDDLGQEADAALKQTN